MFGLISGLVLLIVIAFYFTLFSKRENIAFWMRCGRYCYQCKTEIPKSELEEDIQRSSWNYSQTFTLCKCCDRDGSIDDVLGKPKTKRIMKIKQILLSERFAKRQQKIIMFVCLLPIMGLVFKFSLGFDFYLTEITNIINLSYWSLMFYQLKISTIKRKK